MGRFGVTARLGYRAAVVAAALAGACRLGGTGGAAPPAGTSARAPVPVPGPVGGRVVDRQTRRALPERTVLIGDQRTTTQGDGSFAFENVPGVYDLAVLDAKRDVVTIYRGLTRRDPLLVHGAARESLDEYRAAHSAKLFGSFTVAGRPLASGAATLGFFSPALAALAEPCAATASGAPCDPLALYWNGPAVLQGEAVAIAIEDRGPRSADTSRSSQTLSGWAGRGPLTVATSQAPTVGLALAPMPARRVRGDFRAPPGVDVSTLIESYRLPLPGGEIPVRRYDRTAGLRGLDDELPDLGGVGASLCVTALSDGDGTASATRCGVGADPITLTLEAPPRLAAPANKAAFEPDTSFAWSRFAGGVQVLELLGGGPDADRPDLTVYTMETTASWQRELAAARVAFPKGCSIYQVTAGGYGPFPSMDDAFGPAGLGAFVPAETRSSQSAPIAVTVPRWPRAQPGTFEAKLCHYPYAQGIVCDGTSIHGYPETYVLSAINNKLRAFPEFTKAIGIYCVRDCETARRFMRAYSEYSAAHPGFDEHQPLDMEEC